MSPFCLWRLVLLFSAFGFLAPPAYSQSSLGNTTLGKSQNSSQDLMNSLIPGPEKYGKSEKKSEVDPKTLQSKKSNDTTFSGGINDIGVDWRSNGMGKPHTAADADPKKSKPSNADAEEKKATASKSADTSETAQSKEQKTASTHDEKSSSKEKASAAARTDGDH